MPSFGACGMALECLAWFRREFPAGTLASCMIHRIEGELARLRARGYRDAIRDMAAASRRTGRVDELPGDIDLAALGPVIARVEESTRRGRLYRWLRAPHPTRRPEFFERGLPRRPYATEVNPPWLRVSTV